jgi:hypothetical protein
MKYTIQIVEPCNENWDAMTQQQGGRHCAQCSKTVVDFTGWEKDEVFLYLQQQGEAKVCGRFRQEQLNVPMDSERFVHSVTTSPLPLYRKVAAILLMAIGLLQMDNTKATAQQKQKVQYSATTDTVNRSEHMIMGGIAPPPQTKKLKEGAKLKKETKKKCNDPFVKGDVALIEETPNPVLTPDTQPLNGLISVAPQDTVKKRITK